MTDWVDLLFDDLKPAPLLTQSPVARPDPIPRPEPGGARQPMPAQRMPSAAPQQREIGPAPLATAPQPEAPLSDPAADWMRIMRRHGIATGKWSDLVDYYSSLDRGETVTRPDLPVPLDTEIRDYVRRFPGLSRRQQAAEPPATAQPAPAQTAPAQPPAVGQTQAAPQPRNWADELSSVPMPQAAQAAPSRPANPNAEPDAPTWYGRAWQAVRGKQDPRYAGTPTIAEVMLGERGDPSIDDAARLVRRDSVRRRIEDTKNFGQAASEMGRWAVGASDEDMARFYKDRLGPRFIGLEKDANGFDLIRFRDERGQPSVAYVNKPGLDMQDVMRGAVGAVPFVKVGQGINRLMQGAGWSARMGAQGAGAAATSIAQDATAVATDVSPLDVEGSLKKAGIAAVGGAAGEGVGIAGSYAWRKLVTEPRFFNRATGELTDAGAAAAREAGLDPAYLPRDIAEEFSKELARTGTVPIAAKSAGRREFGIRQTEAQVADDTNALLREQRLLGGVYGDKAAQYMQGFNKAADQDIRRAVAGETGIAGQLAPGRAGTELAKDEMGANVRASVNVARNTAREAEREAWEQVPRVTATEPALAELPKSVAARLDNVVIDEAVTPTAAKMAQQLDDFIAGKAPTKAAAVLPDGSVGDVGAMRKRLLAYYRTASTPEDKRAAGALYDAYNDWIPIAARESGDEAAAAAMVTARGISRRVHEAFDGPPGSPGAKIMKDILGKADSAEGVINSLFASNQSQTKNGTVTALNLLKKAYDDYLPPEAAKAAWDDLRLAYWQRITRLKTGEEGGPQALSNAIKTAVNTQGSVTKTLYSPDEIAKMMRLATTLEEVARRNPNKSWSGVTGAAFMREIGNFFLRILGANSVFAQTVGQMATAPIRNAYGIASARRATGGGMGASPPSLPAPSRGGYGAGAFATQEF